MYYIHDMLHITYHTSYRVVAHYILWSKYACIVHMYIMPHTAGLSVRNTHTHTQIPQQTRWATTIPRPPLESSRRGESRYACVIFVGSIFDLFFRDNFPNNIQTALTHTDPD